MALSDMQVFNEYIMPLTIETVAQMVEKFNAASGGAITLTSEGFVGDFLQTSFFNQLSAAQRRVDRYAANDPVTPTDLTQAKHSAVKVAGGFGPVQYEPGQLTWLRNPTSAGIEAASTYFAQALVQDQLNTGINAAVAAISNNADATFAGSYPMSYGDMNNAHAKFGDSSMQIVADVMDGQSYHSWIGQNLTNTEMLYREGTVLVVDVLGKLVVVTDSPALRVANPGLTSILGLVSQGVVVNDGGDLITNIETNNGAERIVTSIQMDYTFGVSLRGYAWDEANGGKSPTDAEIGTGTNWDVVVDSVKHTAGVITQDTTPA